MTTSSQTFYPTGPVGKDTLIVVADADGTLPGDITESELVELAAAHRRGDTAALRTEGFVLPQATSTDRTAADVTTMASYQYSASPYSWSSIDTGSSIWGADSSTTVSYWFSVTARTNQQASGQGIGYYRGYNGSTLGVYSKWYGLGLASSGKNGGGTVPWGEVLASAKFKAMSTVPHLAIGNWGP